MSAAKSLRGRRNALRTAAVNASTSRSCGFENTVPGLSRERWFGLFEQFGGCR
jgi:hypothetical protein